MIQQQHITLKLKNANNTYKINEVELKSLQDLKTHGFNKFGSIAKDCDYIAKLSDDQKISLDNDQDLQRCLRVCTVKPNGKKVLVIRLRNQSKSFEKKKIEIGLITEKDFKIFNELKVIFPSACENLLKRVIKNNPEKDMDFLCTRIKKRLAENGPRMNRMNKLK